MAGLRRLNLRMHRTERNHGRALRRLHQLASLHLSDGELIGDLLAPGHQLQLKKFSASCRDASLESVYQLVNLPTLTKLSLDLQHAHVHALPKLPNLSNLQLSYSGNEPLDCALLCAALIRCSHSNAEVVTSPTISYATVCKGCRKSASEACRCCRCFTFATCSWSSFRRSPSSPPPGHAHRAETRTLHSASSTHRAPTPARAAGTAQRRAHFFASVLVTATQIASQSPHSSSHLKHAET